MLKLQQSNRQEIDMRHAYRFIQHTPGLQTRMTTYRSIVMVEVARDEEAPC